MTGEADIRRAHMRALKFVGWLFAWAVALGCAAWATGAVYFDLPIPALRTATAILFVLLLLAGMLRLRSNPQKFGAVRRLGKTFYKNFQEFWFTEKLFYRKFLF